MKLITNDNTVKDVHRWSSVITRLSEELSQLKWNHDTLQTAKKVRGQNIKTVVLWKNMKKFKGAPKLSSSWVRDVIRNVTDEMDVDERTHSNNIMVPEHKHRACLVALITACKVKLNNAIRVMDSRLESARSAIKAANEHIEMLSDVDLTIPHVSRILNPDDYNSSDRINDPVQSPTTGVDTTGIPDTPTG